MLHTCIADSATEYWQPRSYDDITLGGHTPLMLRDPVAPDVFSNALKLVAIHVLQLATLEAEQNAPPLW